MVLPITTVWRTRKIVFKWNFFGHLSVLWYTCIQKQVPSFQLWKKKKKKNSCKYCWILHIGQTSIRLLGSCFKVSLANTKQSEQHWGLAFVSMMEDVGRNSWSPNGQVGIAHLHLPGLFNYTWHYHSALKCTKTGSLSWIL